MANIEMPDRIGTPEDQLQIAMATVADYQSGEAPDARKAQIAAQQMHGMLDWTIHHRLSDLGCRDDGDFRNKVFAAEPRLAVVRDFANATKHAGYLKNSNRALDAVKIHGGFSRAFSRAFDRARLELHINSEHAAKFGEHLRKGQYLDTDETFKSCMQFWADLYQTGRMPPNGLICRDTAPTAGTDRQRICLPDGINSVAKQLDIASEMVESTSRESTPAAAYLTAATIAPLEHWAYDALRSPMEFLHLSDFRRYVYRQLPGLRAVRELAQAAKSGARIILTAGGMEIALKDHAKFDPAQTFRAAVSFWQSTLSEYTDYRRH